MSLTDNTGCCEIAFVDGSDRINMHSINWYLQPMVKTLEGIGAL